MRKGPNCRPPLIVGVGASVRGDDGIGPFVVSQVRADDGIDVETLAVDGDLSVLPLSWSADQTVVVVDAMVSGRQPGTIEIIEGLTAKLDAGESASEATMSSHGIGLADAVALGRALDRLPGSLTIVAIEAASFGPFEPLSDPVRHAGVEVATRIPQIVAAAESDSAGP